MAKWIAGAISHPGRMKARAAKSGRSTHAQMEHDKHRSTPSLRAAATLGLRLSRMSRRGRRSKRA